MIYLQLFWEYFKTGLFAVGGGLATVPFLIKMSNKTGWFTLEELANMIAVSESTPGPIGVNMSTYVGYRVAGVIGSIVASIGLILPSIIIMFIIAGILDKFRKSPSVDKVFYGIRPASTGMIAAALISLLRMCLLGNGWSINLTALIVFAAMMVFTNLPKIKKMHPLVFIAFAAIVGVVLKM